MAGISDDVDQLRVNRGDFMNALEEVHPAYGVSEEELEQAIQNGIIPFDHAIDVSDYVFLIFPWLIRNHRNSFEQEIFS